MPSLSGSARVAAAAVAAIAAALHAARAAPVRKLCFSAAAGFRPRVKAVRGFTTRELHALRCRSKSYKKSRPRRAMHAWWRRLLRFRVPRSFGHVRVFTCSRARAAMPPICLRDVSHRQGTLHCGQEARLAARLSACSRANKSRPLAAWEPQQTPREGLNTALSVPNAGWMQQTAPRGSLRI